MKLLNYVSVKVGYPQLYPLKIKKLNGHEVENRPREVPHDLGLSQWMLNVWRELKQEFKPEEMGKLIVLFSHNDVEYMDETNALVQIFGLIEAGYDMVGLAGTNSYDPKQRSPKGDYLIWSFVEPLDGRRGQVVHQSDGRIWLSFYGPPGEAKVIDGLCMACSGRLADEIDKLINPLFHRDWYDISFSYNAHLAGHKIYVMNSMVKHYSMGEFGNNWILEGHKFQEHYCDGIQSQDIDRGAGQGTGEGQAGNLAADRGRYGIGGPTDDPGREGPDADRSDGDAVQEHHGTSPTITQ